MRMLLVLIVLACLAMPIRGEDCPCGPVCVCDPCECWFTVQAETKKPAVPTVPTPDLKLPPVNVTGPVVSLTLTVPDGVLASCAWIIGGCLFVAIMGGAVIGRAYHQ